MKRFFILLFSLFICSAVYSQYIGWGTKKISRNVRWECDCQFETVTNTVEKFEIHFEDKQGVTKMIFYLENGECYGYSLYCDNSYEEKLNEFIDQYYEYNPKEDFFENKRSYLFFQSDREKKIIHVIDRLASAEKSKSF